jgi:glyceraldehyde-3-phosphate dehydrogenase (NADP+)
MRECGPNDGCEFIMNGKVIESKTLHLSSKDHDSEDICTADFRSPTGTLADAKHAFRDSSYSWTRAPPSERIAVMRNIQKNLTSRHAEITRIVKWDTNKCTTEAGAELDEVILFMDEAITEYERWAASAQSNNVIGKRCAVGQVLCWGPEINSVFIDTLRCAIAALLVGNVVIVKIPCTGGLKHIFLIQLMQEKLPPDVLQYVLGPPDELARPVMRSGEITMLAMTGERSVADKLIHAHPKPHRLKMHLDLAGDILAVITPEAPDMTMACREIAESTRACLHSRKRLRLIMAHTSVVNDLLDRLPTVLQELGCCNETRTVSSVQEPPEFQMQLVRDATSKGASVVNHREGGGKLVPLFHGTVMQPTILYPVTDQMKIWHEDPICGLILITPYEDLEDIDAYIHDSDPGLQVALFAKEGSVSPAVAMLADHVYHRAGNVVINYLQCVDEQLTRHDAQECLHLFETFTTESRAFTSNTSLSSMDCRSGNASIAHSSMT